MRFLGAGWACALALVLASCQDYNFNPVGRCVIQPGTKRVTLSNISSADVLFVVDDSGSMGGEQQKLAANFAAVIDTLDASNAARAAAGLQPFDFHIAVTTTSMFWNYQTATTCSSSCTGAAGQLVCCKTDGTPAKQPKACTPGVTSCPTGTTCGTNCQRLKGENYCCNQADGSFPAGSITDVIPCSTPGIMCGTLETHYAFGTCSAGTAVDQWPFPEGDFVSWTGGSAANPRVLHFDKSLYPLPPTDTATLNTTCALTSDCSTGEVCVASLATPGASKFCRTSCTSTCPAGFSCIASACQPLNDQGFTSQALVNFFAGPPASPGTNANVVVGTCGSGEEQALAAARRAIEKATAGQQKDTYARQSATPQQTWDAATRTAGSGAAWLTPGVTNSKLVLVFVGDEDDCSSPADPSAGVVMLAEPAGAAACTRAATTDPPLGHTEYTIDSLADFFMGQGRPVGAAFIFPAAQTSCTGNTCTAGLCCDTQCTGSANVCSNATCGAQAAGTRLLAAANALGNRGASVVLGSICDPNFGSILNSIADLVKPPSGLELPSMPAANEVTLLRIAYPSGETRKVCGSPLPPASYPTLADAQATRADWWFTASADVITQQGAWNPVAVSTHVYINPLGNCIANPGETYSADYLGQLPAGGCWNSTNYTPAPGETTGDAMCRAILGGVAGSWTCFAGANDLQACVAPTQAAPGTCICGSATENCPGGRLP